MIIHICPLDKFIPPYIDLIEQNSLGFENKYFILSGEEYKYDLKKWPNIEFVDNQSAVNNMLTSMKEAEKIILHGLWSPLVNHLLLENEQLLTKGYWLMWGGDFYFPEKQSETTKKVIEKVGHCLTYIKGDFELAKQWYGATGVHINCLGYTSNTFKNFEPIHRDDDCLNIQIGNSADPSNNHLSMLTTLHKLKLKNIKIFAPLSYGNKEYAANIENLGKKLFEDKFVPLIEHMPLDDYKKYLQSIDIAIFNHDRQQAMGNTINLLGMGKKLYMKSSVTPWKLFKEQNLQVFDIKEGLSVTKLPEEIAASNSLIIKNFYTEDRLINDWKNVFEY